MTLDELVAATRSQAGSVGPLDLLATAARQQRELTDLGEDLLDYWVQHARAAGCSWSQVGTALGVSKQAAQQRHSVVRGLFGRLKGRVSVATEGLLNRFTRGARSVVVLAQEESRRLRHDWIGTEHLLLGLLAEGEGVAARALLSSGIDLDRARTGVEEVVGCGSRAPTGHIPFTPRAKRVLELALEESLALGHDDIGTEHVLLGLLTEGEGAGVEVITRADARLDRLRESVLALLRAR